jgi:hypothetical protein
MTRKFNRPIQCSFLGVTLFAASWAHATLEFPPFEAQGRVCYGFGYATDHFIDFYNTYDDCHRMAYFKRERQRHTNGLDVWTFYLTYTTRTCPYAVVEVTYDEKSLGGYTAYYSMKHYRAEKMALKLGDKPSQANGLQCPIVRIEKKLEDISGVVPESRRVPVVRGPHKPNNANVQKGDRP